MRFVSLLVIGGVMSGLVAAACDSSSTSSSSGGFTVDGGNYQYVAPDGGTLPDSGGSPDGSTGTPDGGSGSCTVTLSGAVSKTLTCMIAAAYVAQDNATGFSVTTPAFAQNVPEATFAFKATGELQQQTYAWMDSTEQSGTVYEGGTAAWELSLSNAKGSSTVSFTTVGTAFMNGADKVYTVHGTVTAVLVSQDGSASDIAMTVTF